MDYAVLEQKSPSAVWGEVRSQRRSNQKKSRVRISKKKKSQPVDRERVWNFLKTFVLVLAKASLAAICAYWIYMGYLYLTTSPQFAVTDVKFSGNRKLDENQLREAAGPLTGKNIFLLNLEEISRNLTGHPWIQDVSVQRMFPRGLAINVRERVPFARIKLDRVYVMDNFGVLISNDGPEYKGLPMITGAVKDSPQLGQNAATEEVIRGLQTMHNFNRLPFFKGNPVYAIRVNGDSRITFLTRNGGVQVHMALGTVSESFKKFLIVLDTIEEGANKIDYIDLSFKDQVVVKHKQASRTISKDSKEKT